MMLLSKALLLVASVAVSRVAADQIPDFVVAGRCPTIDEQKLWNEQQPNFSKFAGVWYQQAISVNPYQRMKECVHMQYDFNGSGFDVTATGITDGGKPGKMTGSFTPMPLGEPHLVVQFKDTMPAPLVILDTDYTSYACIYSCMDFSLQHHSDFAFYFTRSPSPNSSLAKKCEEAFKGIGFDIKRLQKTIQGGKCNYEVQKAAKEEL